MGERRSADTQPDREADPWPSLRGLDTEAARSRLNGDLPWFNRLLAGLLREFEDLAVPPATPIPETEGPLLAISTRYGIATGLPGS